MRTNYFLSIIIFGAIFIAATGFNMNSSVAVSKHFEIGSKGKPISSEKKNVLLKAYKAQFGAKSKIDRVEFVGTDDLWLVFQSGAEGTNTLAIQTQTNKGKVVILANSLTNTCSGNPCSYCFFESNNGCTCNKNTSGTCNHTQTNLMDFRILASNLGF